MASFREIGNGDQAPAGEDPGDYLGEGGVRMQEFTILHMFCGLGGAALGFQQAAI